MAIFMFIIFDSYQKSMQNIKLIQFMICVQFALIVAIIHMKKPPFTIEEIKSFIKNKKTLIG